MRCSEVNGQEGTKYNDPVMIAGPVVVIESCRLSQQKEPLGCHPPAPLLESRPMAVPFFQNPASIMFWAATV